MRENLVLMKFIKWPVRKIPLRGDTPKFDIPTPSGSETDDDKASHG